MDREQKERLLVDLLPLIRHVAGKFSRHAVGFEYDDVYQEACIAAYKALDTFDASLGVLSTWVWDAIVLHLKSRWVKAHRAKRWTGEKPKSLSLTGRWHNSDNEMWANGIPDYRSDPFEQQADFNEAIRPCYCHERELLIRHYYEGYTFQEMGEQQHLSTQRVQQKTAAAIARLRRWGVRK